jgi:hypothetical protein
VADAQFPGHFFGGHQWGHVGKNSIPIVKIRWDPDHRSCSPKIFASVLLPIFVTQLSGIFAVIGPAPLAPDLNQAGWPGFSVPVPFIAGFTGYAVLD